MKHEEEESGGCGGEIGETETKTFIYCPFSVGTRVFDSCSLFLIEQESPQAA